jgi:transposase
MRQLDSTSQRQSVRDCQSLLSAISFRPAGFLGQKIYVNIGFIEDTHLHGCSVSEPRRHVWGENKERLLPSSTITSMEDDMARKKVSTADETVRNIRRKTRKKRKKYSWEEEIRIVLEGLRGEQSVAELCRREGISESLYYRWSKEFLEAGKERLVDNTKRQASSQEVTGLRRENKQLKQLVAEPALKNLVLKKVCLVRGVSGKTDALFAG